MNLTDRIDETWKKFANAKVVHPPETLYHYTSSASAVESILSQQKIWCSPHDDLNDPSEIYDGLEKAHKIISEKKSIDSGISSRLKEMINRRDLLGFRYFFFCLTAAGPDDIAQWRSYGANGTGYCIGFDQSCFFPFPENNIVIRRLTNALGIVPIIYDDKEKSDLIERYINSMADILKGNELDEDNIRQILAYLVQMCAQFKHSSYSSEKEWRHMQLSYKGEFFENHKDTSIIIQHQRFREKLIEELPATKRPLDGVTEIICGPKQNEAQYFATEKKVKQIIRLEESTVPITEKEFPKIQTLHEKHILVTHSNVPMI